MKIDFVTCKIHVPKGTDQGQVQKMLDGYSSGCTIGNHVADQTVGCNTYGFSVVDVPEKIMPDLYKDKLVQNIDLMASYSVNRATKCGECEPGG